MGRDDTFIAAFTFPIKSIFAATKLFRCHPEAKRRIPKVYLSHCRSALPTPSAKTIACFAVQERI
jgi:hypothetical protein